MFDKFKIQKTSSPGLQDYLLNLATLRMKRLQQNKYRSDYVRTSLGH